MKKYCLSFLFVLIIFANTACDAANTPRPRFELYSQNFNGGNPEIWITITPNGQTLQDIRIEWGRNSVETQPPVLYATSGLNELESAIFLDANNNNIINQPIQDFSEPFRLYVKFGFSDLMDEDEVLVYKVRTTHQIKNDQGEDDILYTWSEQFNIDYEPPAAGGSPGGGGGSVTDKPCVVPIPAPIIVSPKDGARCVGDFSEASNEVVVEFRWDAVDGVDKITQAYQVEIRKEGEESCIGGWEKGVTGFFGNYPNCWVTDMNSALASEILPSNTIYEWRVRASCVPVGGELTSGEFTDWQKYATATSSQCENQ